MCRNKSLLLSLKKTSLIGLLIGLIQCQFSNIPEPITVQKGELLSDPVFKAGTSVNVIDIPKSIYDQNLKKSALDRPKDLQSYYGLQSDQLPLVQPIAVSNLGNFFFNWTPTGKKKIMVAIFRNSIRIEDNEIDNKEDIMWLWTSNSDDKGGVSYANGFSATYKDHKFILDKPISLPVNTYVWCVWAWNEQGTRVTNSSRELPLRITEK